MKFGKWVVKCRIPILVLAVALLVPSLIGMIMTRINYDMLTYLCMCYYPVSDCFI